MGKRKYNLIVSVSVVLLALVVLLNLMATFAYFQDKKSYNGTLEYGSIKINANNEIGANSYFASSLLTNAKPGDYILSNDASFSLDSASDPTYVRAKYTASVKKSDNLFDINATLYKQINCDISIDGNTFTAKTKTVANPKFVYRVPTTVGSTYTVSVKNIDWNGSSLGLFISSKDDPDSSDYGSITKTKKTLTFKATTAYVYIQAYVSYGVSASNPNTFTFENLQLELGSSASQYLPYGGDINDTDKEIANYLKYRSLDVGDNKFSAKAFVDNAIALNYDSNRINVNNNYENAIDVGEISWAQNYSELNLDCDANTQYTFTCDIDTSKLDSNANSGFRFDYTDGSTESKTVVKSTTSLSFTSDASKTLKSVRISGWQYSGWFTAYNIKLIRSDYYWSEKIGDYYYLLDASTNAPLMLTDSSKTYTFLSKESSKIADNFSYGSSLSGNPISLNISFEAIQAANLAASDTSKTLLQNIKEKLDTINSVPTSGTYTVKFVVNGTTYTKSGLAYGGEAALDTAVVNAINGTNFGGLAFSANGYPVITKTGNCHSSIDLTNKKLKNITENLTLYAVDKVVETKLYTVTFKNGTTVLQSGKVANGNCHYLGAVPTKDATNTTEYVFSGWKVSGGSTIYTDPNAYNLTADTTFEAQFTERSLSYNISYVLNDGYFTQDANVVNSYTYGTTVTLPMAASGSGKQLINFNTYSASLAAGADYTQTETTAKMTAGKTYILSFDYVLTNYGGGSIGCGIGCGPSGSYTRDIVYQENYVGSSGTFTYKFTPTADQLSGREYLAIRFARGSSTAYATIKATNIRFEELQEVARKGYVFEGWYEKPDFTGTAITQISASSSGNKTYYAKWKYDGSTISLNLGGGNYSGSTATVKYTGANGSTLSIPNPTRDGYLFSGWDSPNFNYTKNATLKINKSITSGSSSTCSTYNNSGNGTVTQTVISDSTSSTGYSVKVVTNGTASPGAGGFYDTIYPSLNKRYLIRLSAKIPVGYYVAQANNTRPFDYFSITNKGTGEWGIYQAIVTIPHYLQGTSTSFGYIYLSGTSNTSVTWYYNDFKIYELASSSSTDYVFDDTNVTLTANWAQKITKVNFNANGGTVTAQEWGNYYSKGGVNAVTNSYCRKNNTAVGCPTTAITKSGYTFGGWWTGEGGTGSMLISSAGVLQEVSGYTTKSGSSVIWSSGAEEITLYAKWT